MPATVENTPSSEISAATVQLLMQAREYVQHNSERVAGTYTSEEYFQILLKNGVDARLNGNYGIAAAVVERDGKHEIVFLGQNNVFSGQDPHGHAEMNAVKSRTAFRKAVKENDLAAIQRLIDEGKIYQFSTDPNIDPLERILRPAPTPDISTTLFTTLEPCPMCTEGAVINAAIKDVIMASKDDLGGQLFTIKHLAPIWSDLAEELGINPQVTQSENPADRSTYIPKELQDLLLNMFFGTRDDLDRRLISTFATIDSISLYLGLMRNIAN